MKEKTRCQSCGMPINGSFGNLGTNTNGSPSAEYCKFCFENGEFTAPALTLDEMIQRSVDFMTASLSFTPEAAAKMSNDVIPKLARWTGNGL